MTITVLDIRDMTAPGSKTTGSLRAYATIQVGPLIIFKCRLIKQPGQKAYVCPPQQEWMHPSGRMQYTPLVKWPEAWKQPILTAVWDAYAAQRGTAEDQPQS